MWGQWQGGPATETSVSAASAQSTVPQPPQANMNHPQNHANPSATSSHPPQQELSDMLQMLGQSEATPFEDLTMFNTFSE